MKNKRYQLRISGLAVLLMLSTNLFSAGNNDKNFWRCKAIDSSQTSWSAESSFERAAINKAYHACKKQSRYPKSCKTAREYCDAYVNGINTTPMWRCTALDQMAKAWLSAIYRKRDDAAIGAREYCKSKSSMPDSCYINLLTCRNLNYN